jgi:uncharacterized repeat protein (TIGR01451 family)
MKKQFKLCSIVVSFLAIFLAAGAIGASALTSQPPNIRVLLTGPSSAQVGSPYVYTVNVKNIGGSTANGVKVIVDFPETNTSPQKYILGTLSGIDSRCQVVSRKLNCQLGNLTHSGPNQTAQFTFNLALPVSTRTLQIKATGSSTSSNEADPLNNVATITPTPAYASNQLTSATVLVSMCTGQGLSSFFECELFSGSQQHITLSLNADYSVTYSGQTVGSWDQFVSPQKLHMLLYDGGSTAEFNGFATNNTCFEGLTTFTPASPYVAPYKVCVQ